MKQVEKVILVKPDILIGEIFTEIITSNTDMRIVIYLITNTTPEGIVKYKDKNEYIGVLDLASIFEVSRKKVGNFISKCISHGLIKKNKRKLVVNPYIVVPYNTDEKELSRLKAYWDSDFNEAY